MAYRVLLVAVLHNMDRDKQVDKETKSNGQMAVVLDVTKLFVKVSKKGSKEGRKHGGKRIWVLMRKREREREKNYFFSNVAGRSSLPILSMGGCGV